MTLVPSHLRPLSGNNLLVFLLFSILMISCASSAGGTKSPRIITPDKSEDKKEEVAVIKVDTVQWTFASEDTDPPISAESKVGSYILNKIKKDHYNVAVMLPIRTGTSVPNLDKNNKKFADFYAGLKLSGSEQNDVSISVKTYYTNRDINSLERILTDFEYFQPDLIIGSYEREVLSQTADWAIENRVPLISPWLSSTKITEENVFYLQMRPSTTNYYEKMLRHINYNYAPEKVCIIGRDTLDDTKIRALRRINENMASLPETEEFDQLLIRQDQIMQDDSIFFEKFESGIEVFVLPQYALRDEIYVYSCLRKLYAEKGENEFYIYTMPILLNSDRIDVNILKNLNTRTVEFRYPDKRNPEVQKFRNQYYNNYGWLPTADAYYGYDLMNFIAYGLENYGQYFHYYMTDKPLDLMQMKVDIAPYYKNEGEDRPDFLTNRHLYIIEYDDDHFVIKDIK